MATVRDHTTIGPGIIDGSFNDTPERWCVMYVIMDWQNEEDIIVLRSEGKTIRFERIEDATQALVIESHSTGNVYLNIVRF